MKSSKKSKKKKQEPIRAAGTILYRYTESGELNVCIIHRPYYDDWSWPKGKLRKHESLVHAAIRETAEETGYTAVLHTPAGFVSYTIGSDGSDSASPISQPLPQRLLKLAGKKKEVSYWTAYLASDGQKQERQYTFIEPVHTADGETDDVRWVDISTALSLLTREDDKNLARHFASQFDTPQAQQSFAQAATLILIRNAKAVSQKNWDGDPVLRPLTPYGAAQAYALAPELSAYLPGRIYASNSTRCISTASQWAQAAYGDASQVHTFGSPEHRTSPEQSSVCSHKTPSCDEENGNFTYPLGEVMEYLLRKPRRTAALVATQSQLKQACELLAPLTRDDAILSELQDYLISEKSLSHGEGVALTIVPTYDTSYGCVITHTTKVEPIVF